MPRKALLNIVRNVFSKTAGGHRANLPGEMQISIESHFVNLFLGKKTRNSGNGLSFDLAIISKNLNFY